MTKRLREATQFFARNAGYCTPPGRMACAKALAEAELAAEANGWECEWQDDDAGCSGCDCGSKDCACSAGTPHETLGCVLRDEHGKALASLWGICGATDSYRRVVEAELASEALAELNTEREERHWEAASSL